jgi:hypothetical protein
MYQTEIQFFWPLTEQIPLELDYTDCARPIYVNCVTPSNMTLMTGTGLSFVSNVPTWTTSINIDTNNITVRSKNLPPLYRRVLYKLLGIRWEQQ